MRVGAGRRRLQDARRPEGATHPTRRRACRPRVALHQVRGGEVSESVPKARIRRAAHAPAQAGAASPVALEHRVRGGGCPASVTKARHQRLRRPTREAGPLPVACTATE